MKEFGEAHEKKKKNLLDGICSKYRRELSPVKLKHLYSKLKAQYRKAVTPSKVLVISPKGGKRFFLTVLKFGNGHLI